MSKVWFVAADRGIRDGIAKAAIVVLMAGGWHGPLVAQQVERDAGGIFDNGATLELLFDGGHFTEGPAMSPDGILYFSDITFTAQSGMQAGHIWRYDPATRQGVVFRSPSGMSNGLAFDQDGRLLAALGADFGGRAIVRTDMTTGRSVIVAGLHEGRRLNSPNDLAMDEQGRIYFTDPRYIGHEPIEQPVMGVYRVDTSGAVTRLISAAGMPNGILVSPDQNTLYVASIQDPLWSGFNALLAFDLAADGSVSNRRTVVDFRPAAGPDGMAIDVEGNLYLARPSAEPGVYVYSPDGRELAYVRTPFPPSNVTFGRGEHDQTLFITAQTSVYSIASLKRGYHPASRGAAGH